MREQVDGILCLADILTDESCAEAARAEAAAVVAQITSPHHTSTQHLASFLESMQDIVTALISEYCPAVCVCVCVWRGGRLGYTQSMIPTHHDTYTPI